MNIKPAPETPVLAWDGTQWVRAVWVPKLSKEQNEDSDFFEYDEATDQYYWPEGWYELQSHGDDALLWHIHGPVNHWRPMPLDPTKIPRGTENPWRDAVEDELVIAGILNNAHSDPRQAIKDVIAWNCQVALDPLVSKEAQDLIDKGKALTNG